VIKTARYILTYVCEVLAALRPSEASNLPSLDAAFPAHFAHFFQQHVLADFGKDFDDLVEFVRATDERSCQAEPKRAEKKRVPVARRRPHAKRTALRAARRVEYLNGSEANLFDNGSEEEEEEEKDVTTENLNLDDFTEDEEPADFDGTDNENFEDYYDDDDDDDDDDMDPRTQPKQAEG